MAAELFNFGPFAFDPASASLRREGKPVAVGQRALALLQVLLEAEGAAVDKAALMERAWPGTIVEEGNLTVQIAALRKALGTQEGGQEWIVTVPRVGYRLVRGGSTLNAVAAKLPLLAVLPFQNLGGDPEQDYFADGVADDLISALSRFRSFAVIARSSSFALKGRAVDVRQAGRELGVRYAVEGSVRRAGNRLRIIARLVDVADGANLWAQTFDGAIEDVFDFQDRITASVAAVVEPTIQLAEYERSRRERAGSIAAYDLYLRAVAKIYTFAEPENAEAIELLERAVALDPENGVFLGFAAWALEHRSTMSWPPVGTDDKERCIRYAHAAVRRASNDATVLTHCGLAMQIIGHDYDGGLVICEQALELNPNDVVAMINGGIAHLISGDIERARSLLHRAIELYPNNASEPMAGLANVYCCLGQYETGLTWATRSVALRPNYPPSHWILVIANAQLGRLDAAREAVSALLAISPGLTVQGFAAGPASRDAARRAMLLEGFRLAGLPEQ